MVLRQPLAAETPGGFNLTPLILLRALRKNWYVVALFALVGVVSAILYTARQPRIYEAVATVQFDPQPLTPLGGAIPSSLDSGPESYWSNLEYFATQHQILTSRRVASAVVKKLGLERNQAFLGMAADPARGAASVSVDEAAEVLRSRLTVKPVEDSRLATVRYRDGSPERAQKILATLIDTYVEQNLDSSLDATNKTAEWLDTQMVKLRAELEAQEMDLHEFKKKNNLLSVSYDDQSNMLRAEIAQLNDTLTALKTKREGIAARLAVIQEINPEDPRDIPQSAVIGGEQLGPLQAKYLAALDEQERLLKLGKGENHPDVRAAASTVSATKGALLKELHNVKSGVAADLAAVTSEYNRVSKLFEAAKKQALELNLNELHYSRLRRSKDNTEKLFGLVLERSTESGLSKVMPFNNVRALDRPLLPGAPVSPQPSKNLAGGLALGLLLGLVGAVGRELLDRTFRSADDVESGLGLSPIGSLPDLTIGGKRSSYYGLGRKKTDQDAPRNGSTELVVHHYPKSVVAEAARAIRTNLMFASPDKPYQALLVTSAGPAEGKTTVATSIAIAMAQAGQRVCLIDCDLRRPRVHQLFNVSNQAGVTTVLLDPDKLDATLQRCEVQNLELLPAGPLAPNPAELVHTERFAKLLEQLRAKYDRVVVDSPPIGVVTDGVIIATRVDATVLVVRALKTRRDQAHRALRSLRDVGINCPGFVLNATTARDRYEYSSYYAPYGGDRDEQPS